MQARVPQINVEQASHKVFETQVIDAPGLLPIVSGLCFDKSVDYFLTNHQTGGRPHFPPGRVVQMTRQSKPKMAFDGFLDLRNQFRGSI